MYHIGRTNIPRDSIQRNCFEFALYHDCIPNRIGSGIRNYPRRRCRHVTFGALPTLSVRGRAIIVLNDHRFWGYPSGPSSLANTLPSSIHGHAARRSALPRERFSPLTHFGSRRPPPRSISFDRTSNVFQMLSLDGYTAIGRYLISR